MSFGFLTFVILLFVYNGAISPIKSDNNVNVIIEITDYVVYKRTPL